MGILVGGRYDSAALAPAIRIPAFFVLAGSDDVVPPAHGRALMDAWGGPKTSFTLADTGHRRVEWRDAYWKRLSSYLESVRPRPVATAGNCTARTPSPGD